MRYEVFFGGSVVVDVENEDDVEQAAADLLYASPGSFVNWRKRREIPDAEAGRSRGESPLSR